MSAKLPPTGTIIRGADGNLYFIKDSQLTPFRIPDSMKGEAEKDLASKPASTKTLDAVHITGGSADVSFNIDF